jgi:hypothetical protein
MRNVYLNNLNTNDFPTTYSKLLNYIENCHYSQMNKNQKSQCPKNQNKKQIPSAF